MLSFAVDEQACTRCGLCVDVCPTGALRYELKGVKRLL